MAGELSADFEVRVGEKVYRIWANGMAEGFEDGDKPVTVINRIPIAIARAMERQKADVNGR